MALKDLLEKGDSDGCRLSFRELYQEVCEHIKDCVDSRETYQEDTFAKSLIPNRGSDCTPVLTTGNGNCLYNAVSLCLIGNESLNGSLRSLTALELFLNVKRYTDHPYYKYVADEQSKTDVGLNSDDIFTICLPDDLSGNRDDKIEMIRALAIDTVTDKKWSGMIQVLALSNVLNTDIKSICPDSYDALQNMLNCTITPTLTSASDIPHISVSIMWTRESMDNQPGVPFEPDHIVAIFEKGQKRHLHSSDTRQEFGMKKKQRHIDTFFRTPGTDEGTENIPSDNSTDGDADTTSNLCSTSGGTDSEVLKDKGEGELEHIQQLDICNFLDESLATDEMKFKLIMNRKPDTGYAFPARVYKDKHRKDGTRKRFCNPEWFSMFDFLAYSKKKDGIFCLACVLFPTEQTTSGRAKVLIQKEYTNWKDAKSDMKEHSNTEYHRKSYAKLKGFEETYNNPSGRIDLSLTTESQERVRRNRQILLSIIKAIEFCGRQGIALQGHRDDVKDLSSTSNLGNLKALVKFRIDSGDTILSEHISAAAKNATYISKTSQNSLLQSMRKDITDQIVTEIKSQPVGPLYGIQVDEVTDVSNWEQEGILVRYAVDLKPKEMLLDYNKVESTSGEVLYNQLKNTLTEHSLDPKDCRSQTFDGSPNMSGKEKGVSGRFLKDNPNAVYTHCHSHSLNLTLSTSSKIPEIHCMIENLKAVGRFFDWPKRQRCFEKHVEQFNQNNPQEMQIKKSRLKPMCETRWVERHTSFEDFKQFYEVVCTTLQEIASDREAWDSKSMTEASGHLNTITSSSFIVAFNVHKYVLGFTKQLSLLLQSTEQNILVAYEEISLIKDEIQAIRLSTDTSFTEVFAECNEMGNIAGLRDLAPPRRCGRQTLRSNVPAETNEEYWRRSIFIPFLDSVLQQLDIRFGDNTKQAIQAIRLLPSMVSDISEEQIASLLSFYGRPGGMPSPGNFKQEVALWRRRWSGMDKAQVPSNLQTTMPVINQALYPNIYYIMYAVLLTSVTSAGIERSHSAFKLIKTERRSTMAQDRLVALMLLYVHKDINLNYENVIDDYASKHPRRMLLMNPVGSDK